jgi:hypothetical protein
MNRRRTSAHFHIHTQVRWRRDRLRNILEERTAARKLLPAAALPTALLISLAEARAFAARVHVLINVVQHIRAAAGTHL